MDNVLRAIVLFAFVFLVVRVMGRRELAKLEPLDLILLIMLGDAVQQGLTQDDYSVTGAVLAVSTIALLQLAVTFLSWRFKAVRRLTKGDPIVLVEDGKPIEPNLRANESESKNSQKGCAASKSPRSMMSPGRCWNQGVTSASSRRSESTIRLSGPLSAHCSIGRTTRHNECRTATARTE
jgi:hypothetical protein